MHTSPRLALDVPDGGDNESAYPADAAQSLGILDNTVLVTEGTLAARPAANTVEKDRVYKATDTGQWFISDGTNWSLMLVAGAWQNLTLASGWTTYTGNGGYYTPSARIVGDRVELKGAATNAGATSPCATLPSGAFAPLSAVRLAQPGGGGAIFLTIAAGATSVTTAGGPTIVYFDGLSYSLT